MKTISKLITAVGVVFTAVITLDTLAWIVTGTGLIEMLYGESQPPLLGAISHHLAGMPAWLFFELVALAVVVLAALLALVIISQYKKELTQ